MDLKRTADLKHLETWDRAKLEAEARRIGVWAPHRKESAELIRRIRAHHTAPLRRAGRFLKRAANFALSLRPALPAAAPVVPPRPPKAGPTATTTTPVGTAAAATPAPVRPSSAPAAGKTARLPPKKIITDATLVEDDDAGQEPIATRTMARLLAEQGHTRRALAIYKKLLRERPADVSLKEEAAALSGTTRARTTSKSATPPAAEEDDEGHATGEVVFVRGPDDQLIVAWSLPKAAAERAQSILGPQGRPTARVVVVRSSSGGGVLRETFDLQAASETLFEGEGSIPAPPGSRVTAAIGLLAGERFVSVAHAEPRRV